MNGSWSSRKAEIPIDIVILMIAGLAMVIAGLLLFPVYAGRLPYYENGLHGLVIFIFALQMTVLAKTPFGDLSERTLPALILGVLVAGVGIITCFIPDLLKSVPRIILFLCFGPGGFFLLLRMFISKDKFRLWKSKGGILAKLAVNCASLYFLSIFISALLLKGDLVSGPAAAFAVLLYGILLLLLCFVLYKVYAIYPEAVKKSAGKIRLSDERAIILITGVLMVLLGILLIPVTLGLLPFSGSAQLGLLVVIISLQMIAFGSTPLGSFARTWPLVFLGLFFASMGMVSCIIPGIMLPYLTLTIAFLNIIGGLIPLARMLLSLSVEKKEGSRQPLPPILIKLAVTQAVINILSIVFGTSMLIRNLIPGPVIGTVLAADGIALLYLLTILSKIDRMAATRE